MRPFSIRLACLAGALSAAVSLLTFGYYLLDTSTLAAAARLVDGHSTIGELRVTLQLIAIGSLVAAVVTLAAVRALWTQQRWGWRWLLGASVFGLLSLIQPTTIAEFGVIPRLVVAAALAASSARAYVPAPGPLRPRRLIGNVDWSGRNDDERRPILTWRA